MITLFASFPIAKNSSFKQQTSWLLQLFSSDWTHNFSNRGVQGITRRLPVNHLSSIQGHGTLLQIKLYLSNKLNKTGRLDYITQPYLCIWADICETRFFSLSVYIISVKNLKYLKIVYIKLTCLNRIYNEPYFQSFWNCFVYFSGWKKVR